MLYCTIPCRSLKPEPSAPHPAPRPPAGEARFGRKSCGRLGIRKPEPKRRGAYCSLIPKPRASTSTLFPQTPSLSFVKRGWCDRRIRTGKDPPLFCCRCRCYCRWHWCPKALASSQSPGFFSSTFLHDSLLQRNSSDGETLHLHH